MVISLTGFMGCGKSSVGRRLSELLCCPFMDLDDVIEERSGRRIPEIFESDGEAVFRRIELETLREIISQNVMTGPSEPERLRKQSLPQQVAGPSLCGQRGSTVSVASPARKDSVVLALGGGAVMTGECAKLVHEHTVCIYLRASVDTLVARLKDDSAGRPLLSGDSLRERITGLMVQRTSTYEKTAHITIDTDGKSIEAIAEEIRQVPRVRGGL
ncbi:MAG: shikimate kinase [Bacteroidales bacterium]|nr:shikimate kinase [Bacteroidales bacterium]